jgi:nitrate reductase NapAB chaperone NapD
VPIKSYIAWPAPGMAPALERALAEIPGCEVLAAENEDLLVLVTETPTGQADETLFEKVRQLETLHCITFIAGTSEGDLVGIHPAPKEAV